MCTCHQHIDNVIESNALKHYIYIHITASKDASFHYNNHTQKMACLFVDEAGLFVLLNLSCLCSFMLIKIQSSYVVINNINTHLHHCFWNELRDYCVQKYVILLIKCFMNLVAGLVFFYERNLQAISTKLIFFMVTM